MGLDVVKTVVLKIYQDLAQEKSLGILPELRNVAAAFP